MPEAAESTKSPDTARYENRHLFFNMALSYRRVPVLINRKFAARPPGQP
jgi:hypothetical protein